MTYHRIVNGVRVDLTPQEVAALEAEWAANAPTLGQLRLRKLDALAAKRWEKEAGGIVFNGMTVATDAVSQTKIIGAVVGAQMDPQSTIQWKMADGSFSTLDATAVLAMAMAVRAHVQACFDNEAEIRVLIQAAGTKEELDAIDIDAGWPSNV